MKLRNIVTIASHAPVLARAAMLTTGSVLELGGGAYSTPLLAMLCRDRGLVTLESDREWQEMLKQLYPHLEIRHSPLPASDPLLASHLGLAFVDNRHAERAPCIAALHHVPVIVVHDTEPEHAAQYPGMAEAMAAYRFRFDIRVPLMAKNQTSVISDTLDVAPLFANRI